MVPDPNFFTRRWNRHCRKCRPFTASSRANNSLFHMGRRLRHRALCSQSRASHPDFRSVENDEPFFPFPKQLLLKIKIYCRFFVDQPENPADPCFVRSAVMWTMRSADHMNSSHFVSHNLYRNPAAIHCILRNYAKNNRTFVTFSESAVMEPAIPSEFPFEFMNTP